MNKEEFVKKDAVLERQRVELRSEYIRSNSPYPVGTKLKVTGRDGTIQYGIVKGYEINVWNDVMPVLSCIKKDGTAHPKNTLYVWCGSTFEVCMD